jgi:hypothetical protein
MSKEEIETPQPEKSKRQAYRIRLPGFVSDEAVGLGEVIKQAAYAVGIKPCGGCEHRATTLNSWFVFSRWPSNRARNGTGLKI